MMDEMTILRTNFAVLLDMSPVSRPIGAYGNAVEINVHLHLGIHLDAVCPTRAARCTISMNNKLDLPAIQSE